MFDRIIMDVVEVFDEARNVFAIRESYARGPRRRRELTALPLLLIGFCGHTPYPDQRIRCSLPIPRIFWIFLDLVFYAG